VDRFFGRGKAHRSLFAKCCHFDEDCQRKRLRPRARGSQRAAPTRATKATGKRAENLPPGGRWCSTSLRLTAFAIGSASENQISDRRRFRNCRRGGAHGPGTSVRVAAWVERLVGSAEAKARLRALLDMLSGRQSLRQASQRSKKYLQLPGRNSISKDIQRCACDGKRSKAISGRFR
jgi:hypothetical protein